MKTISLLVFALGLELAPCANLWAEEQVTVTFEGNDITMPKSVFEAGQNAGVKMVEQFIEDQEKNQAQSPLATPTPTPTQEESEAQMQEVAQKMFDYAKTELKYSEEDARSFVAVALVTYIQEGLKHAFSSGGAPTADQAKKQQQIVDSLKITNLYSYEDGGYLRIRGDVTNTGSVAVKSIAVELQYFDAQGRVIDQGTAYVDSGAFVLPGKTGTFTATQQTRKGAVVSYRARVIPSFYTE